MATGRPADTRFQPGRLVLNPTSFAGSFPYGGTEIGRHRELALTPVGNVVRVESEGLGGAIDILEGTNHHVVTFLSRGWDDDAVELLLAGGYEAGSATGHSKWDVPGSASPGQSALSRAVSMLFVPDAIDTNPALLVYRGVPWLPDGFAIPFQRTEEFVIPFAVQCVRDGSGRTIEIGLLSDLTAP